MPVENDLKKISDEMLAQKIVEGDMQAFEELVDRYEQPILRYCMRLLNFHQQDAEDTTSEVFFKAYKNMASFKSSLKFSAWLYRIAHNSAVNLIRSKSKLFYVDVEDFWHIPSASKEESTVSREDIERVLEKLSATDRGLLVLFHIEEKSLKEIGDIFKLTENTVAVKLRRARERAKKFVNENLKLR